MNRLILRRMAWSSVAACALLGNLHADETITYLASTPERDVPFQTTAQVPSFDPALGTLLEVRLRFVADMEADMEIENTTANAGLYTAVLRANVPVAFPAGSMNGDIARPRINAPCSLAAFDGASDTGGLSGLVALGLTASATETMSFPAHPMYVGGPGIPLNLPVSATNTSSAPMGTDFSANLSISTSIAVTYVYDAAPDCDGDGTPDSQEPDCNMDGIPDDCEPDCDADGVPDGCEPDSDGDGQPDGCDLASGVALPGYDRESSLLIYPMYDNRQGFVSIVTVTNASEVDAVDVRFVYRGRYGPMGTDDDCLAFKRSERLTPSDTFSVFTNFHAPDLTQGFLYVYATETDQPASPIGFDHLIGSSLIVDGLQSFSFSVRCFGFRALVATGEETDVDADGLQDLNGLEYEPLPDKQQFPRFLGVEPMLGSDPRILLISLSGGTQFDTTVSLRLYNDNSQQFAAQTSFRCWDIQRLADISFYFDSSFLSSATNDDPDEVFGLPIESGWFELDGVSASSSAANIVDPAVLGVLIEEFGLQQDASLPFSVGRQDNGVLYPSTPFGAGPGLDNPIFRRQQ